MKRETYFGGCSIEELNGNKVLSIESYAGDETKMQVWDAEIKDNSDSPEIVGINIEINISPSLAPKELSRSMTVKTEIYIHKKDCLQLANFLLGIHTEYQNQINEEEAKEFAENIKNHTARRINDAF